MKNLARCLVMLMIMSVGSNLYAQNWIPYQEPIQPVVQTQVVYVSQPQPVVVYQWVPYVSLAVSRSTSFFSFNPPKGPTTT